LRSTRAVWSQVRWDGHRRGWRRPGRVWRWPRRFSSVEGLPRSNDLECVGGAVEAAAIAGAGSGVSVLLVGSLRWWCWGSGRERDLPQAGERFREGQAQGQCSARRRNTLRCPRVMRAATCGCPEVADLRQSQVRRRLRRRARRARPRQLRGGQPRRPPRRRREAAGAWHRARRGQELASFGLAILSFSDPGGSSPRVGRSGPHPASGASHIAVSTQGR